MSAFILNLGIGILAFASTNLDDLFILLMFFSIARFNHRQVVLGQFLGMAGLIGLSMLGAEAQWLLAPGLIHWMGLFPLIIGIKGIKRLNFSEEGLAEPRGTASVAIVSWVTLANGGDNLAVYIPLFSSHSRTEVGLFVVIFALMTALWCVLARAILKHRSIEATLRRSERIVLPVFLIALGIYIFFKK